MVLINAKIVLINHVIENGFLVISNDKIVQIGEGSYSGNDKTHDVNGNLIFPGFIDVHLHGTNGIDFMDASVSDYKKISDSLFSEGVTTYLATTLTNSFEALKKVCLAVKEAKKDNPSLYGIHFEGPYISEKYKGAQNEKFIRNPNIEEFNELNDYSGNNIKYISLAPEKEGAMDFIEHLSNKGVVCSAGHTDASFDVIKTAINYGLSNVTHTHNAMSSYHHRNPGVVTAAMYFDELYTECICDKVHVCPNTLKTFYKIVGPNRFMIITDALKVKNTDIKEFLLAGLECETKKDAAYLKSGPLAGSILTMNQALRNMVEVCNLSLCELAKISSTNAAKCLSLNDRGEISVGKLADLVVLDCNFNVKEVYKMGRRVK